MRIRLSGRLEIEGVHLDGLTCELKIHTWFELGWVTCLSYVS